MKLIPILSSIIIAIGCLMPWLQLGAFFKNRGIDGPDGALMLVLSVITGGLAFYNYSKSTPKSKWIYVLVGIIGIFVAIIDLREVITRAEIVAEEIGKFNLFFGGEKEIPLFNFVGTGLYIVLLGSIGLIISGFEKVKLDLIYPKIDTTPQKSLEINEIVLTKKCPACAELIKNEAKICRFCQYKFTDVELMQHAIIENEIIKEDVIKRELNELYKLILIEKKKLIFGGMTDEIMSKLECIFESKNEGINLLNMYQNIFQVDLIEDLKKLSYSYNDIKRNVSIFINLDIVDENYPHAKKY